VSACSASGPARVQLLYLSDPVVITTVPSEQSIRQLERKVKAIWQAIERACERDDFRPKQSRLCNWCAYQAFCPAFGGDPDDARALAAQLTGRRRGGHEPPHRRERRRPAPSIGRVTDPPSRCRPKASSTRRSRPSRSSTLDPPPHHSVEPPHELTPIQRFDDMVDGWFDHLRGTEPADRILYALTELGDFGLIWVLLGWAKAPRSDADTAPRFASAPPSASSPSSSTAW